MRSESSAHRLQVSDADANVVQLSIYDTEKFPPKTAAVVSSISPNLEEILKRKAPEKPIMDIFNAIKHPMPAALLRQFISAVADIKEKLHTFYSQKKYDIFLELRKIPEYQSSDMESLKEEIQRIFDQRHMSSTPYHTGDYSSEHNGRRISEYDRWLDEAVATLPLGFHVESDTLKKRLRGAVQVKNQTKEQYLNRNYRKRLFEKCMSNERGFMNNLRYFDPGIYSVVIENATEWYNEEILAMQEAVAELNKKNTQKK